MVTHEILFPDGRCLLVRLGGQPAEVAERLSDAGTSGLTAHDFAPVVRLRAYFHKLRRLAPVLTNRDRHSGQYPGHHDRYRLSSGIRIRRIAEGKP